MGDTCQVVDVLAKTREDGGKAGDGEKPVNYGIVPGEEEAKETHKRWHHW